MKKIVVGLSGGVDSSVALLLLKEQGFSPVGVFLDYSWDGSLSEGRDRARQLCRLLKVPFFVVSCRSEFNSRVVKYFLETLRKKETPNPCVICNSKVKIKKLFEFASGRGIKKVATGHYARIKNGKLLRGKDKIKDQSYFLCLLKNLKNLVFPLGEYTKKEVYRIAGERKLDFILGQKESQDLCFLSEQSLPSFLEEKIGFQPGEIVDTKGVVLGRHKGLHFYTIGQRKGVGLSGGPWWVAGFDKEKNRLIITRKEDDPVLYTKEVQIVNSSFIPKRKIKIKVKPRYQHPLVSAVLYPSLKLVFGKSQKAVTPGQWAVFYDGDVCLGGGVIDKI